MSTDTNTARGLRIALEARRTFVRSEINTLALKVYGQVPTTYSADLEEGYQALTFPEPVAANENTVLAGPCVGLHFHMLQEGSDEMRLARLIAEDQSLQDMISYYP